jgi:hypothetical protein
MRVFRSGLFESKHFNALFTGARLRAASTIGACLLYPYSPQSAFI